MAAREGRISGARTNRWVEGIVHQRARMLEYLVGEMLQDGYAPFTEPMPLRQQYELLNSLRAAGDPRYWDDPAAQKALEQLAPRFGGIPNLTPGTPGSGVFA